MLLESYGTAGARRRARYHCDHDKPVEYRGTFAGFAVFLVHATDGRSYELSLSADDMAAVAKGAAALSKERKRAATANGGGL